MKEIRTQAPCAVFEERIVVSGGFDGDNNLNTVEAYDHIADEWTYMPSMIESTFDHSLIAIKNKLFAVGRRSRIIEMYDSKSNTFVAITKYPTFHYWPYSFLAHAIGMGEKFFIFFKESSNTSYYDADKDVWFENIPCFEAKSYFNFFLKIPKLTV